MSFTPSMRLPPGKADIRLFGMAGAVRLECSSLHPATNGLPVMASCPIDCWATSYQNLVGGGDCICVS